LKVVTIRYFVLGNSRKIILPNERYFLELLKEFPRIFGDFISWKFLALNWKADIQASKKPPNTV